MNIAVTGGAGFIGSHLVDRLIKDHKITVIDNFCRGSHDNLPTSNRALKIRQTNLEVSKCALSQFDVVFHLAAKVTGIQYNVGHHWDMMQTNLAINTNVMESVRAARPDLFVYVSTACIYPHDASIPTPESDGSVCDPEPTNWGYGIAKWVGEQQAKLLQEEHGIPAIIVRFFNCVLEGEMVPARVNGNIQIQPIEQLIRDKIEGAYVQVLAFDEDNRYSWHDVNAISRRKATSEDVGYKLRTKYGRMIRLTANHHVFRQLPDQGMESVPVLDLSVGDRIAVPGRIDVPSIQVPVLPATHDLDRWEWFVEYESVPKEAMHNESLVCAIRESGRYEADERYKNGHFEKHAWGFAERGRIPLALARHVTLADNPTIYPNYSTVGIQSKIEVTPDILWLIGFYIAEGCSACDDESRWGIHFASHNQFLERAASILEGVLPGCTCNISHSGQSPVLQVGGKAAYWLIHNVLGIKRATARQKELPSWTLSLPLDRLRHVMAGLYDGDGTKGKRAASFVYSTTSSILAHQVLYILTRFGVVASLQEYDASLNGKITGKTYQVYACGIDDMDIADWDNDIPQRIQSREENGIVWANIKSIEECPITEKVYDISVPTAENFVAGVMTSCHNSFGPRDYYDEETSHVAPALIKRVMDGENPVTVWGTGNQTRALVDARDIAKALWKLMDVALLDQDTLGEQMEMPWIVNIGHEREVSIRELVHHVIGLSGREKVDVEFDLSRPDGYARRAADTTRLRNLTGWVPDRPIEETLIDMIEDYRKRFT